MNRLCMYACVCVYVCGCGCVMKLMARVKDEYFLVRSHHDATCEDPTTPHAPWKIVMYRGTGIVE